MRGKFFGLLIFKILNSIIKKFPLSVPVSCKYKVRLQSFNYSFSNKF